RGVDVHALPPPPPPPRRLVELPVAAAEEECLARCRLGQPEQQPQGGGLAGAVRAEEPGDGAGAERKRHVIDGEDVAVPLGQRADRDNRMAGSGVGRDGRDARRIVADPRYGTPHRFPRFLATRRTSQYTRAPTAARPRSTPTITTCPPARSTSAMTIPRLITSSGADGGFEQSSLATY